MNSNTSGKRCEYTYENYLEKERKLNNLKENYSSMEKQNNENIQKIDVLQAKIHSFNEQIAVKRNILHHCETECTDLIGQIEEAHWRQTKAETILKSEKEYLAKYKSFSQCDEQKTRPEISFHLVEFNFNISSLEEKRDALEKRVLESNELVEKLSKEVEHTSKECAILQESMGEARLED